MEPINNPTNDQKLNELLKEWTVSDAPESLDKRISKLGRNRWSFLLTGSIRVPVPVGLAIAAILLAMTGALVRQRAASVEAPSNVPSVSLLDFRPVADVNVRIIHGHEAN